MLGLLFVLLDKFIYASKVILVLCAIITPDWSPVTMGVLAAPMILLYELALLLARII